MAAQASLCATATSGAATSAAGAAAHGRSRPQAFRANLQPQQRQPHLARSQESGGRRVASASAGVRLYAEQQPPLQQWRRQRHQRRGPCEIPFSSTISSRSNSGGRITGNSRHNCWHDGMSGRLGRRCAVRASSGDGGEQQQQQPKAAESSEDQQKLSVAAAYQRVGLDAPPSESGLCDPLCSVDEMSSEEYEEVAKQEKSDLIKAVVIGMGITIVTALINLDWVEAHKDVTMCIVFALGYLGIIFEESLAFNKSGVALLMAVALWVIRSLGADTPDAVVAELTHQSSEVAEIVFFLLGAMTIVEIVDAHQGFRLVTDSIQTRSSRKLLWLVGTVTFFLSSILDNLTSTIVMVSLLRKLVPDIERRRFLGAVVVIAANSGGAWTPIGDVTTTMLWIHGQISTLRTMQDLFIPSVLSLAVPLAMLSFDRGLISETSSSQAAAEAALASEQMAPRGRLVFAVGVGSLLFVPVFKSLTGLPPFLGMLAGLGTLWLLTDAIHYGESDRQRLRVPQALSRIDTQGVLFFLGILLAVGSLDSAGLLKSLAVYLDETFGSAEIIAGSIGLASAVIDNVPLVAATMGMYDIDKVPMDAELWQLIAYCAGTGGSILVIGSAAGVAFMGMEKADFIWYFRKVSGVALAGYAAGMAAYLAGGYLLPADSFGGLLASLPFF